MNPPVAAYSRLDRLVHGLAMRDLDMQKLLARIEDRGFDKAHADVTGADPIFITSLPRAGTTLLLEIIAGAPQFAAHSYRDMPFLLCPLLWDAFSRRFRKPAETRPRAHGDGMLVGYDSVEAFEEIVWRAFWPGHFGAKRIRPWQAEERDGEGTFLPFLRQHMRKIIALGRRRGGGSISRYVSKNNANIARLGWLQRHLPDATILIPYREPAAHIRSLARQHANFLEVHGRDAFALRYMESLGHFEFGQALRPIDFDGWLDAANRLDARGLDFWAEYWIVAFGAVLRTAEERCVVFSYDGMCAAPVQGLGVLAERIGVPAEDLTASAGRVELVGTAAPELEIAPERARRLEQVLAALRERALF